MDQNTATTSTIDMGVRDEDLARIIGGSVPPRSDLVAVLQHWAAVHPDSPAFYFTDGENPELDQCLTFGQLDASARNIAGYLQKLGGKGQRVLLLYPPVLDFVNGFFWLLVRGCYGGSRLSAA
jgi:acyl-CoA synthetase (AMP-forming)/AMP-acid ligase II